GRVDDIQLGTVVREDRVDGGDVRPAGVLPAARRGDVLEDARLVQAAGRAEVDVLPGGEDALVHARDAQVGPVGVRSEVVGAVVAQQGGGDDGPRRADAAAD